MIHRRPFIIFAERFIGELPSCEASLLGGEFSEIRCNGYSVVVGTQYRLQHTKRIKNNNNNNRKYAWLFYFFISLAVYFCLKETGKTSYSSSLHEPISLAKR